MATASISREPGTRCRLYYDYFDEAPVEGDFVRTPRGTCYLIEAVRPSPSRPGRLYLDVMRLEHDAVAEGDPGVWPLHWYRR